MEFLREARKLNSAVATEKRPRKEKWQNYTGSLDTADLTRGGAKKSEPDDLRLAKRILVFKIRTRKAAGE